MATEHDAGASNSRGPGKPTKYQAQHHIPLAQRLCTKHGFTDQQLADAFGVCLDTIYRWKRAHPEFAEAIRTAKDEFDTTVVEAALLHRATGYSHPDVDIRVVNGELVQTPITKHYPPDSTAAIFFLKNRNPGRWRDRQQLEHEVAEGSPMEALLKAISGNTIKPKGD